MQSEKNRGTKKATVFPRHNGTRAYNNSALAYVFNGVIGHQLPSPNGEEPYCAEGGEAGGSAAEAAAPDQ